VNGIKKYCYNNLQKLLKLLIQFNLTVWKYNKSKILKFTTKTNRTDNIYAFGLEQD
jgi:hypothetical protein